MSPLRLAPGTLILEWRPAPPCGGGLPRPCGLLRLAPCTTTDQIDVRIHPECCACRAPAAAPACGINATMPAPPWPYPRAIDGTARGPPARYA
jgi:hypothetical protein